MSLHELAYRVYPDTSEETVLDENWQYRAAFLSGCELMREAMEWALNAGWTCDGDCWYDQTGEGQPFDELITLYLAQRGEQKEKG